jgi:uncharacterized membrane protein
LPTSLVGTLIVVAVRIGVVVDVVVAVGGVGGVGGVLGIVIVVAVIVVLTFLAMGDASRRIVRQVIGVDDAADVGCVECVVPTLRRDLSLAGGVVHLFPA